jgi:hypothetical protein
MRYVIYAAGALLTLSCSLPVLAQPADPAAANRELIGEGPNVDVQQSAIGTLDVGGAGAANPNVTGGNLRGNLGASRPQPAGPTPSAPNAGIPNYTFQTPSFGPDARGDTLGRKPTKQDLRVAEDLILPRFRSQHADGKLAATSTRQNDDWRYQYFNGRWWYWRPNNSWAFWNGSQWRQRTVNQ